MDKVRRELLLAIVFGLVFGVIVAGTFWLTKKRTKTEEAASQPMTTQEPTPTETVKTPFSLNITAPENGSVVDKSAVEITGQTLPNTLIIVSTENGEITLRADQEGSFLQKVKLAEGENPVIITAVKDNQSETVELLIIREAE